MPKSVKTTSSTLDDDLNFFPQYKAVFLYRLTLTANAIAACDSLEGTLDEKRMIKLNAEAERTKNYARAAALYLRRGSRSPQHGESFPHKLMALDGAASPARRHFSAPFHYRRHSARDRRQPRRRDRPGDPRITGAVQTIPSLALLALLVPVPFFGISPRTAIAALFLYGLLPIVRNTATGLQDIAQPIRESAIALGWNLPRASGKFICRSRRARSWRNQDERSHQHRHRHPGRADRRRRLGRTNPQRPEPERSRHDFAGRHPGGHSRASRAMELRFARPPLDSEGTAVVALIAYMPIASINPTTGETLKEFAAIDSQQIEEKLAKADARF